MTIKEIKIVLSSDTTDEELEQTKKAFAEWLKKLMQMKEEYEKETK